MCESYCSYKIIYTKNRQKSTREDFNSTLNPPKIDTKKMQKTRWTTMINSVNLSSFYSLEPVIGCPDCASGGESWVAIKTNKKPYSVRYQYQDVPKLIANLVEMIRN